MKKFMQYVKSQARKDPKRVVFPEGFEERVLMATAKVLKQKTAIPILVGDPKTIKENAKKLGLTIDFDKVEIHNPVNDPKKEEYAKIFYELRKNKGITMEEALKTMEKINYFGTMMVYNEDADGLISGTTYSTADTVRPALQIIKTEEKFHKVSGVFFMILEKRLLLFADAAITIEPNSHDLAAIAIDTAETAKRFNLDPKIAMLSFSTYGSASHPLVDKVKEATALIKDKRPDLKVAGEMQVDAALVPDIAKRKSKESPIQGDANVLIFPNLEAGNIAYKLVERLAKAKAIGPILQGLKKPVNDLSRGCHYMDIVNLAAFTSCECQAEEIKPKLKEKLKKFI